MKKFKKAVNLITIILISLTFIKCQNDEDPTPTQTADVLLAKDWFKDYEAKSRNYALFQNLEYDWNETVIQNSEDGTKVFIVPITEDKKDPEEIWEQKLYLYKTGEDNYKVLLFEIYPDNNVKISSQSINGGNFNGYMSTWDLKTGFVSAVKFVNNQVVENGILLANVIQEIKVKSNTNKITTPSIDVEGSGGESSPGVPLRPVVIQNNYHNP
jgi:hypothetical protein